MNPDASQHAESDEALPIGLIHPVREVKTREASQSRLRQVDSTEELPYKEPALVKTLFESTPVLHGAPKSCQPSKHRDARSKKHAVFTSAPPHGTDQT
eukprot:CAMPEP_0204125660 /NCGR_PEP_ID=MMETSP0361-20130328/10559_1 /ASSEMBLY_ACC=CAM_ASM_000343 /TAXON_ID=268821 /ORGANISM="Scrippsiella Hangoei, Strain SHTV-5" /LENGTH=97 /DNA_ID=CAMNT_0051077419 /DNA_START=155 /DNA_END=444 /DNA_ORIENTATION=+